MVLLLGLICTLWPLCRVCEASPSNPWGSCPADKMCKSKFGNSVCDKECTAPQCLRDGLDCVKAKESCKTGYVQYCRDHYDNAYCENSCNTAACGWDGSDCFQNQQPNWARGTLVLQTSIPLHKGPFQNGSLLWALSVLLQTSVKLRGAVPFQTSRDLFSLEPEKLVEMYQQTPTHKSNGSLLYLQVDNRPCTQQLYTCFPYATEAADFLTATLELNRVPALVRLELAMLVAILGMDQEIPVKETIAGVTSESPAWLWPVVGVAVGMGVALAVVALALLAWTRRRRERREGGERVRHRSTATDNNNGSKAWTRSSAEQHKGRGRRDREKDRSNGKKKKKKGQEAGKRRSEPLGEDAIRMRPLRKELDIGSDTDMTQSSLEDITRTICDHRSPAQKRFDLNHQQPSVQALPRRWERSPAPLQQRATTSSGAVQWCGPDGSVVLIRAVRSGLDRVVLELLRAGVPVNNTDHTGGQCSLVQHVELPKEGRSALHWACSVNHLSLARTLIRYGAVVDLQDHKGETALFLSALHGCYETARLLLLNGANQELTDRRGRRPIDVAREALHHQVLELLLAHRVQRSPFPVESGTEVLWDDRGYLYSPWPTTPPSLPGRSASFSGVIGNRNLSSPPPSIDWPTSREQCNSAQNWRPVPTQSATALVSPRILGHPPRPISTLQEVTSEAEEEEREPTQDVSRASTAHFQFPQPAPRQRSFSCTQPALQRRFSSNQPDFPAPVAPEKRANEHVEIVIVPHPMGSPSQTESISAGMVTNMVQTETENKKSCEPKNDGYTVSNNPASVQTVL